MAGAGERKGKKDDNGIGTAIDFVLSNARLVLGVGGAAMLGIATLAVKRVSACSPGQGWERWVGCLCKVELTWIKTLTLVAHGSGTWSPGIMRRDLKRIRLSVLLGLCLKEIIGDTNKQVYPSE